MRAVCQRVREARVLVDGETAGEIGIGVCVLLGVARGDDAGGADRLARKIAKLRIFPDDEGRFDRSVLDVHGSVLAVSQFTLVADYKRQTGAASPSFTPGWKGNRPSFTEAARSEQAEPLYERFCDELRALGVHVEVGVFGARMQLEIVNDGPVTIILDVEPRNSRE